jgi:cholesterol transport system auxiliary component
MQGSAGEGAGRAPPEERLRERLHVRRRGIVLTGLLAAAVLIGGCGSSAQSLTVVDLTAPTSVRAASGGGQIIVTEPLALAVYETDRIVVRSGGTLTVLPGAQWSDRLPRLLQARLIQTFENGRRAASVGRPADRLTAERQLVAEVRAFEIDADSREAVVAMSVKVVGERRGRILAARLFTAREPVSAVDAGNAPQALDRALGRVLAEIVGWAR